MNRLALDRRRFLKLAGATALTYPFLRGTPSFAAGGANPTSPYLVLLFTSCGVVRYKWGAQGPAATGGTPAVTNGLVFRDTLSAFTKAGPMKADLTNQVTVLDGLANKAAGGGTHEAGFGSLWTGADVMNNTTVGAFPSIDQALAPLLASQLGINTPYPSIQLMAQSNSDYPQRGIQTRMLYDASGNFVDPITSPSAALSTLFPSAAKTSATSTGPDKTAFLRQKVSDQVNGDLTALQGRLCTEDRQQLQNLQSVYNQILTQLKSASSASAACSVPTVASSASDGGSGGQNGQYGGGPDPFPANVQAMGSILAMALACDLTRIGSLQLSHALSPVTHVWIPSVAAAQDTHHNFSHRGPNSFYSIGPDIYNEMTSASGANPQQLVDIDAWYAQQVASFAYTLSQLKSPIGSGTLLDQTVICCGSEIDMGAAHNHDDTPFLLIGGAGGKLKRNQLVRFPINTEANGMPIPGQRFHNDLLITLAKLMGVALPGNTFGNPAYCTTPIQEILV